MLRGWLHAAETELAAAKQQDVCRAALDLAAQQIAHPDADTALPYVSLNAAHLARWRGNCLTQLTGSARQRRRITDLALIGSPAVARIVEGPRLGLTRQQVEVAESDSRWRLVFDALAAELLSALADLDVVVEHVGSTSVPGLAAKPIIDVAVGIRGKIAIERIIQILDPLGYIYRRDEGASGGQLFVVDEEGQPGNRIAYIHLVTTEDPQWARYLGFRDLLRGNPDARIEYEQLKRRLAAEFPDDRIGYTSAKESFIENLLATS